MVYLAPMTLGDATSRSEGIRQSGRALSRSGKNQGAYHGEPIDIAGVLRDDMEAAVAHGWSIESLLPNKHPPLVAFSRRSSGARRGIYFSTGIHGDEPAGPLAIRQFLREDRWPADADLWVMPCLNPEGFVLRRRTNGEGIDLNRDYRQPRSAAIQAHVRWLGQQPRFDFAVCLHEDWEAQGFYLYELNPDRQPSLAESVIEAVSAVCPIDRSNTIDGWPAYDGIIRPQIEPKDRPEWPEAIHLVVHRTRHSYTFEAPSDFDLPVRVRALATAVQALVLCCPG